MWPAESSARLPEGAGVAGPVAPRGSGDTVLEEETDDADHGQAAIGKFGVQFPLLDLWVRGGEHLPAEVALIRWRAGDLLLGGLAEGHVGQNLCPARHWHLADGRKPVRDVGKLHVHARGQIAWELARDPWQKEDRLDDSMFRMSQLQNVSRIRIPVCIFCIQVIKDPYSRPQCKTRGQALL